MLAKSPCRRAYTLIEVLVAAAIFAIVTGFTLVAVQKVRERAAMGTDANNIRQIVLGIHSLADTDQGEIARLSRSSMKGLSYASADTSLFTRLLPYVHGPRGEYRKDMTIEQINDWSFPNVTVYRNPSDPSWDRYPALSGLRGKCSYALNMLPLDGSIRLASSLPDGGSQTIAVGDKYYSSDPMSSLSIGQTINDYSYLWGPYNGEFYGTRRATFADRGWGDVLPVAGSTGGGTRPSVPDKTFQAAPRPEDVDPRILQSAFRAGLIVGMFDGSVRTISPGASEAVFWGLVTPNGGEVGLDNNN